jgi:hypothetical protein
MELRKDRCHFHTQSRRGRLEIGHDAVLDNPSGPAGLNAAAGMDKRKNTQFGWLT